MPFFRKPVSIFPKIYLDISPECYDTVHTFLDGAIRRVIERCERAADEKRGIEPQDVNVLKLLYLIRYLDNDIKSTLDTIVILMADDIRMDKINMRKEVTSSLDRLLNQNYIGRSGNTYSFLTDEEQDIAREIKDTTVDTAQITERIGHLVFGDIYDKKKFRYEIYDFSYDQYVDGTAIGSVTGGMKLNIMSVATDDTEKAPLKLQAFSKNQAIVVLGDSKYYESIENALKIRKYVKTRNVAQLPKSVQDIISDDSDKYIEIAQTVEEEMHMENRLGKQTVEALADTEVYPCIDQIILKKLMTDIGNHIINSDQILDIAEKRRTAVWFSEYKDYYAGIVALAKMQEFYKEHATGFHTVEPKKIWDEYTNEYYKMDTYYRKFHMNYENSKKSYVSALHDLFAGVCDKVEGLYTQWFLGELGKNWTDAISDNLRDLGYIDGIPRQEDFYSRKIKNADNKVYVIISDAMRYEVASSLKEQLSREMQSKVTLSGMQGVFPTITKFGMAALLPHTAMSIEYKDDSKAFKVLADGQSTDSTYREKLLKQANENSAVIKAKDLVSMKRAERSELVKGKEVVYIYHDTIDETSHTSEEKVFIACDETIDELKNIVKIIVNDFSGVNIFITADHGFLYNYSPLTEETKTEKSDFVNRIAEYGRRFALLKKGADPEYLVPVKLNYGNDEYEGYAPRDIIRIKTSAGSGMNFVHGGISLQEMCVPLIEYKHLRNSSKEYIRNKEKYDTKPVKVELLSANHKVSNNIFSLNFYQKDAVGDNREPANYDVYFVDASGKKISDVQKIIADKRGDSAQERTFRCMFNLKSQAYDSKETYYLVIEQEGSTDLPERIEFQIDIAFAADDFGFFG